MWENLDNNIYELPTIKPRPITNFLEILVYRHPDSYDPSLDRSAPRNEFLDYMLISNTKTKEVLVIDEIQTIANYPLTTPRNEPHPNSFKDTIRAGKVTFKYKTTYHTEGAVIISNTKTLDGKIVDKNGWTKNGITKGLGYVHTSLNENGTKQYEHAYSEQCFIPKNSEDMKQLIQTLEKWGIKEGDYIKGEVLNLKPWEVGK